MGGAHCIELKLEIRYMDSIKTNRCLILYGMVLGVCKCLGDLHCWQMYKREKNPSEFCIILTQVCIVYFYSSCCHHIMWPFLITIFTFQIYWLLRFQGWKFWDEFTKCLCRSKHSLKRRLRIRTLQFGTAQNITELYDSVEHEVVLSLLVHKVILWK